MGKNIPTPTFAGDDGLADPAVLAALGIGVNSTDSYAAANAIRGARVFVPVMSVPKSQAEMGEGHCGERTSQMAVVSITSTDGRRGLLAFSSVAAMSAWSPDARPLAALGASVAASALADGAAAVIMDAASGQMRVIETAGLMAMIEDRDWVPAIEDPQVLEAISAALTPLSDQCGCRFELESTAGPEDLRLVLRPDPTDQSGLEIADIAAKTGQLLGEVDLLRARLVGGVALSVGAPL